MNRIKGAVLYEYNQPVVVEDMDLGAPQNGEVLVKMMASGVCHSDWHVVKGEWSNIPTPVILGHEGAGVVEETGCYKTKTGRSRYTLMDAELWFMRSMPDWTTKCMLQAPCEY